METAFTTAVAGWHDFYMLVGGAAAKLVGLLFVAVSLHLDLIMGPQRLALRPLAAQTFTSFVFLIALALNFLIPQQSPLGLSAPLFLTTLAGIVSTVSQLRLAAPPAASVAGLFGRPMRGWIPGVCYLAIMIASLFVWQGNTDVLYWLVVVFITLLVVATRNAWSLLVEVGQHKQAAAEGDPQLRRVEKQLREVARRQRQITRQQEEAGHTDPAGRRRG